MGGWGGLQGAKVQIGAVLLCKSAKMKSDYRVRSTDYGVTSA